MLEDVLTEYNDLIPALNETIFNVLETDNKQRYFFDKQAIADEIMLYAFRNHPTITDSNRYEWMHQLSAKVSIVAQGWKLNYASSIAHREDTLDSIVSYIERTYGTHHQLYAA